MMASTATATATILLPSRSILNLKPRISSFAPKLFSNPQLILFPFPPLLYSTKRISPFIPFSAVEDVALEEEKKEEETLENKNGEDEEEEGGDEKRRKLCVVNLPWSFTAPDMEKLFGECGTVKDVEIIKQNNGKSRGFSFITMSSGEEAKAVVEKFNSYELMGRIIRVEFAKSFRKPAPPPAPGASVVDGRHKIYASNLAWKVRSTNLRDFFSVKFKPLSARVVFDGPTGRSTGYGFVGFATKEEAEAAVSELDGKELIGRPLRLRISEKQVDKPLNEQEDTEQQSEES